jgi:hypothetical protein
VRVIIDHVVCVVGRVGGGYVFMCVSMFSLECQICGYMFQCVCHSFVMFFWLNYISGTVRGCLILSFGVGEVIITWLNS